MSEEVVKKIKTIGIAGAGGIGAYLSQFLYDYGVNRNQYPYTDWKVDIYDDDIVDVSNLLHQNYSEDDLGKPKAQLIGDKFLMTPQLRFMTEKDFPNYDIIFSCVDSMSFRKKLYQYGWEHPELFWIDGRCSSRQIGLFNSTIPKKQIENDVNDSEERAGCLLRVDKENKVSHATPMIIAGMMLQSFLNHIRGEDIKEKVLLYI